MKFKHEGLETEFHNKLHPEVRALVLRLSEWSEENDIPAPFVTAIGRTRKWYGDNGLTPPAYSWHYDFTACDLRNQHYSGDQLERVVQFLRVRCPPGAWEFIHTPHGTAPHIHVARRDAHWRGSNGFPPKEGVVS